MVEEMRRQFRGLLRDIGFIEGVGLAFASCTISCTAQKKGRRYSKACVLQIPLGSAYPRVLPPSQPRFFVCFVFGELQVPATPFPVQWVVFKSCCLEARRKSNKQHRLAAVAPTIHISFSAVSTTHRTAPHRLFRFPGGGTRYARGNGRGDQQQQQQQHSSNINGGNIQLIKAVVCAGLYPNVTVAPTSLCPTSTSAAAGGGGGAKNSGGRGGGSKGGGKGGAEKTAGEVSGSSMTGCRLRCRVLAGVGNSRNPEGEVASVSIDGSAAVGAPSEVNSSPQRNN